jgi:Ca2+-binding EF-hand superfamily protein
MKSNALLLALVIGAGTSVILAAPCMAQSTASSAKADAAIKSLDTDKDGTLDLTEAKTAADQRFAALDADHDGTLERKEFAAIGLTTAEIRKVDTDKDGKLDKDEYLSIVQARFAAADADHDGTLSGAELAGPAGKAVLALLQ